MDMKNSLETVLVLAAEVRGLIEKGVDQGFTRAQAVEIIGSVVSEEQRLQMISDEVSGFFEHDKDDIPAAHDLNPKS